MAIGQIGMFLPSESQYLKPGTYEAALQAQSVKIANYLSSMDQFYENLNESKRQYDLTLGWQKESFGLQMDFEKEKFGKTYALQERQLTGQEKYNEGLLNLKKQELGLESQKLYSAQKSSEKSSAEMLKFLREQSANKAGQTQLILDSLSGGTGGSGNSSAIDLSMFAGKTSDPFGPDYYTKNESYPG